MSLTLDKIAKRVRERAKQGGKTKTPSPFKFERKKEKTGGTIRGEVNPGDIIRLDPGTVVWTSELLGCDMIGNSLTYDFYCGGLQETPEGDFFKVEVVYTSEEIGKLLEGHIDTRTLKAIHTIKKNFEGRIKEVKNND